MATKADLESLTGERGELVEKLVAALAERNAALAARDAELAARDAALAAREAKLEAAAAQITKQAAQYEALREAYMQLQLELKLLKRRIFIASAERADTTQLQLEFEELTQRLDALADVMGSPADASGGDGSDGGNGAGDKGEKADKRTTKGRRSVKAMGLRTETVDLRDLVMEELVEAGKARRLPEPEVSYKLGRKPAEYYCLKIR
jgi:hypothetical protein